MPLFTDGLLRNITIAAPPQRIVSVVPSQTELLYALGLGEQVVGITKFCIHPAQWYKTKTRVGGTKNLNLPLIHSLQPDLILANKEENTREQIEELASHFPVWVSDVNTLADAQEMITTVGAITNTVAAAAGINNNIQKEFKKFATAAAAHSPRVAYLIWKDPYLTVGGDTFIHHMLQQAGFQNIFAQQHRYPTVSIEDIAVQQCDYLLLSSEPYSFKEKHIAELQPLLPHTKIVLVDGEMFSWYGSRLQQSPLYFKELHAQLALL